MPAVVHIRNLSRPTPCLTRARYCDSYWCRLRGLMFRRGLKSDEGLLLVQKKDTRLDSSIHMLFMWMDLTVVWINASFKVVDIRLARRWRLAYFSKEPARYVLELPVEAQALFEEGDLVEFEKAQ